MVNKMSAAFTAERSPNGDLERRINPSLCVPLSYLCGLCVKLEVSYTDA